MPNRRRRKLSKAMSAVAALAVASPCAYFLVYESTAAAKPPIQHHDFVPATKIGDLPSELIGALTQGLSQFGINLPPVPSLTGTSGTGTGLGASGLSPGLGTTGLYPTTGLAPTTPGYLAAPGTTLAPTPAAGTNPALPNAALTSPTGVAPGATSPTTLSPAGASATEIPIASGAGLDPGADGTYPILSDPSLGGGTGLGPASPAAATGLGGSGGGGGLINDLMQAANQLGASQAIDLLKGLIMAPIMQSVQNGGAGAAAGLPVVPGVPAGPPAVPGVPAAAIPAVPAVTPPTLLPVT